MISIGTHPVKLFQLCDGVLQLSVGATNKEVFLKDDGRYYTAAFMSTTHVEVADSGEGFFLQQLPPSMSPLGFAPKHNEFGNRYAIKQLKMSDGVHGYAVWDMQEKLIVQTFMSKTSAINLMKQMNAVCIEAVTEGLPAKIAETQNKYVAMKIKVKTLGSGEKLYSFNSSFTGTPGQALAMKKQVLKSMGIEWNPPTDKKLFEAEFEDEEE